MFFDVVDLPKRCVFVRAMSTYLNYSMNSGKKRLHQSIASELMVVEQKMLGKATV